jgi:molecular chaperone DnaK (HSP70)
MSESNTIIGINFGTAYTSIAYLNKVREISHQKKYLIYTLLNHIFLILAGRSRWLSR